MKSGNIIRLESVEALRQENYKKVSVKAANLTAATIGLGGVTNFALENGTARFFYKGSAEALVKAIARQEIADVVIEDPSLEEIFMHYYEQVQP